MLVNGCMVFLMEKVNFTIRMVRTMLDTLLKVLPVIRGDSYAFKDGFMRENSWMSRLRAEEPCIIDSWDINSRGNGWQIFQMALESSNGWDQKFIMKGNFLKERSMGRGGIGHPNMSTLVTSIITNLTLQGFWSIEMVISIRALSRTGRKTGKGFILGEMARTMKDILSTIWKMGKDCTSLRIRFIGRANGWTVSARGWEL